MDLLKKLFKRKEKSNISDQKADDLNLKKMIEKFEFYDENQIKNIMKTHQELKKYQEFPRNIR